MKALDKILQVLGFPIEETKPKPTESNIKESDFDRLVKTLYLVNKEEFSIRLMKSLHQIAIETKDSPLPIYTAMDKLEDLSPTTIVREIQYGTDAGEFILKSNLMPIIAKKILTEAVKK